MRHTLGRALPPLVRVVGWWIGTKRPGTVDLSARHDCQRQKPDQPGACAERDTGGGRDGFPATPTWLEPFPRQGFAADVIDGLIETYIELELFYTYD